MVKLTNDNQNIPQTDFMETFFNSKETDCILYSKEGIEFKIHKEILGQTKFLRRILSLSHDNCCKVMEIVFPCSEVDLQCLVKFLYNGTIYYDTEPELFESLNNLIQIFGFSKERFLPENYTEFEKEFEIRNLANEFAFQKSENTNEICETKIKSGHSLTQLILVM